METQKTAETSKRKHFIDNLRTLTILLLFPYHISMIYNNWGETFYIHGKDLTIPSLFVGINSMWMMPLLFALAGISTYYALEKRSNGEYIRERFNKLFLPFVFGVLLIVPIQPYLASLFLRGQAGYFDSFTWLTDLSGYDGAFSIGHLWFILFLFVFSLVSLPLLIWYKNKGKSTLGDKLPLPAVVLLGLLPCIGSVIKIGGESTKSPTENLAYFLLGYFLLTNEKLLEKLDKYRFQLLGCFVGYAVFSLYVIDGEFFEMISWLAILAALGLSRHYLDFSGKNAKYFAKSSFGVYFFHQSWIVIVAFFIFKVTDNPLWQIPTIFLVAVGATYLSYEICRRIAILRWMFGLKE